jgi:hypothetical protein
MDGWMDGWMDGSVHARAATTLPAAVSVYAERASERAGRGGCVGFIRAPGSGYGVDGLGGPVK